MTKKIKYVLFNINETIKIWIEMQHEFGERWNYKGIRRRLREYILVADSGYFTNENLYYLHINKINSLIMPKSLSEQYNNKLRKKEGLKKKERLKKKRH